MDSCWKTFMIKIDQDVMRIMYFKQNQGTQFIGSAMFIDQFKISLVFSLFLIYGLFFSLKKMAKFGYSDSILEPCLPIPKLKINSSLQIYNITEDLHWNIIQSNFEKLLAQNLYKRFIIDKKLLYFKPKTCKALQLKVGRNCIKPKKNQNLKPL